MAEVTEEFVCSFHSLTGTGIGERRKNLFTLLNKTRQIESAVLDFSSLKPQNPLEEKFKVEALIHFRRSLELMEVLKSENPTLIERVLKAGPWFLEQAFRDTTGEQLAASVFPWVSFNVKVKIVNKLASHLDARKADEFFKAINEKYGLYLASRLLAACSEEVIMNCIKANRIKPTPRQLLIIIKRCPQITEEIFKQLKSNRVELDREYKNVFVYLAQCDALLFTKLLEKYQLSLNLGRRATHRFIHVNKQNVIKNSATFLKMLHCKQMTRSLNQDFGDFFTNLFPASLAKLSDSCYRSIFSLIKPPLRSLDLLFEAFKKTYGSELWDHPEFVYTELLEMLAPSDRENRLKIEYKPFHYTEDEWNCYWNIDRSIPHLKKKISLSSDYKARAKLVSCLVETCRINKDKAALTGMCKYVVAQHRNDHIAVRLGFLTALKEKWLLVNLEEEQWTCVNELIQVFSLNKETFYDADEFLEAYIHFRLRNSLPVKEELTKWLKLHHMWLSILQGYPLYQKRCLLLFGEIIPELFANDLQEYNVAFLKALIKWNNKHPNDKISPFAYTGAINTLKELLINEKYVYSADSILVYCLQQKTDSIDKENLLSLYLKPTNKYADIEVMIWLIRDNPLIVSHNIASITELILKMEASAELFWIYCRNYSHLEIPQRLIKNCLLHFEGKEEESLQSNVVEALSYLMAADEFQKFIAPYFPLDLKVDVHSEEAQKTYRLQKTIGASLKNVIPASRMFDSILVFCKGDYLKIACVSLYSVAYKANENKLAPFLGELSDRAVSVRKHELHLAFRVLDKKQIYGVVNKFMASEKNASVRKFMVKGTLNFFVKNPNEYSWELVKLNVNSLDVNDKEAFDMLTNLERIPRQFVVQYVTFTWDTLSELPDPDGEILSKKIAVLNAIPLDVIQLLPREFCDSMIQNYLFKGTDGLSAFQQAIHSFTCHYIIYCDSPLEKEERLNTYFLILRKFITATWYNEKTRTVGRKTVSNFVREFSGEFLDDECRDKEILPKFISLWDGFLSPHDNFDAYLLLQLTLICTEKLFSLEGAQKLKALCDTLANTYGSVVIGAICDQINCFPAYVCGQDDAVLESNKFDLFECLVKSDGSIACMLLVILLLKNNRPTMPETELKYKVILEHLEKSAEPVIRMYLNSHFEA